MGFWDFLKDANSEKKAVGKAFSFLTSATPGAQQTATVNAINKKAKAKAETALKKKGVSKDSDLYKSLSFLDEKKSPVEKVKDFVIPAVRSIPRSAFTIGASIADPLVPGDQSSQKLTDPASRLIFGSEPLETFQKRSKGNEEVLKGSRFKGVASPLAVLGTGLSIGADVTGLGGGKKQLGKELIEQLAKESTEQGVKALVKKAGVELSDDAARAISLTKDKGIVEKIIKTNSPKVEALSKLDDAQLMERNYIENLQTAQGPGAQLPKTPGNIEDIRANFQARAANPAEVVSGRAPKAMDIREATIPKTPVSGEVIPPPSADPFDEILGAVKGSPAGKGQEPKKGAVAAMKEQERLLKAERGARFQASAGAGKTAEGSEGYFRELGALKGEYSKANYDPLIKDIGPERAESLFTSARQRINATPDSVYEELGLHPGGARLNTQRAVRKVLGLEPGIPTRGDLKLLSVYSPKLAKGIEESLPRGRKIFDAAASLFGNARSAKSTLDFSMGGRQGLFVAGRHPKEWAIANKESVKYAKNADYFNAEMKAIHGDEWGKYIDEINPNSLTGGRGQEEVYNVTDLIEKVPGVKGAARAYTGGLTKLRKDILVKDLKAYGATPEEVEATLGRKGVEGLIEAVTTLTGRGGKKGGWVEKHATTLQSALFSPRLWAARLQPLNPAFWKRIGPAGRKEAMQSLGSFAAVAGTVLAAAVAAGAEVETDPRSSDFLKIKVGDTRYDILGGFQQNLVFGARQALGLSNTVLGTDFNTSKSSTTGAMSKYGDGFGGPNQLSAAFDLVRNKANPVLGAAGNIIEGKDKGGNEVNPLTEIAQLFAPISLQNLWNARNEPADAAKGLPEFVGIGSQTYGVKDTNLSDKQKASIEKITDPNKKEAYTRLFQTAKIASGTKKNVDEQVNKALEAKDLAKAKKLADDYNKKYASAFDKWREQYRDYSDATLLKEYNSNKINLTSASIKQRLKTIRGQ